MAVVLGLPLGGCFFDLGSWGSDDKPKQAAAADKPAADTITPQDINSAKDHATRGQVLAHSGKVDEAQAEFEQALTADPYNIQALYGRGLIYQGRGQHQQAIDDFKSSLGPLGAPSEFKQTRTWLRGGMTGRSYDAKYADRTLRVWTYEMPDGKPRPG